MLKINNLSVNKQKKPILKDVSFEIHKARLSLLLGKSGSGKTTLLRCIAQLENDYQGTIAYEGQSLWEMTPKERCQIIGFVPQSFALFPHKDVWENCAHPLYMLTRDSKKAISEKVESVLCSLDMETFAYARPQKLSGGQQQRIAIARALILNPSFLLFDEPTSALDPENTELFIKIIQKLCFEGRGLIISSQDMAFSKKILDRAFFLEEGRFIESYDAKKSSSLDTGSRLKSYLYD